MGETLPLLIGVPFFLRFGSLRPALPTVSAVSPVVSTAGAAATIEDTLLPSTVRAVLACTSAFVASATVYHMSFQVSLTGSTVLVVAPVPGSRLAFSSLSHAMP